MDNVVCNELPVLFLLFYDSFFYSVVNFVYELNMNWNIEGHGKDTSHKIGLNKLDFCVDI